MLASRSWVCLTHSVLRARALSRSSVERIRVLRIAIPRSICVRTQGPASPGGTTSRPAADDEIGADGDGDDAGEGTTGFSTATVTAHLRPITRCGLTLHR